MQMTRHPLTPQNTKKQKQGQGRAWGPPGIDFLLWKLQEEAQKSAAGGRGGNILVPRVVPLAVNEAETLIQFSV